MFKNDYLSKIWRISQIIEIYFLFLQMWKWKCSLCWIPGLICLFLLLSQRFWVNPKFFKSFLLSFSYFFICHSPPLINTSKLGKRIIIWSGFTCGQITNLIFKSLVWMPNTVFTCFKSWERKYFSLIILKISMCYQNGGLNHSGR